MPKLFITDVPSAADVKVFTTDIRSDADLVIYETTDAWAATESPVWCYTEVQGEADKIICFVDSQWEADLTVFKTDVSSDAGWNNAGKSRLL